MIICEFTYNFNLHAILKLQHVITWIYKNASQLVCRAFNLGISNYLAAFWGKIGDMI